MGKSMKNLALVGCSDGMADREEEFLCALQEYLATLDLNCYISPYIFLKNRGSYSPLERAKELNDLFGDSKIQGIFDVTGGNLANEILPYLNWSTIRASQAVFHGYSDLTTVINAIYSQTGKASVLFQLKTVLWDKTGMQKKRFEGYLRGEKDLFRTHWIPLQGERRMGDEFSSERILGGNIRCLLKLAGTPYFPEFDNQILFLESMGGGREQIAAYLAQLSQMGVFKKVKGILLGTFTQMIKDHREAEVYEILKPYISQDQFVYKTGEIGHGSDSCGLYIG